MMLHDEAWELQLAAYVDGTLSPRQRRRVEEHLSGCAECAAAVTFARAGAATVAGDALAEAPSDAADFLGAVHRRAERQLAAGGVVESAPRRPKAGWRAILSDPTQVRPAFWFLLSLPALALMHGPQTLLIAVAAGGMALGFLMEYALTWEASHHDSR